MQVTLYDGVTPVNNVEVGAYLKTKNGWERTFYQYPQPLSAGRFQIGGLRPGTYRLFARTNYFGALDFIESYYSGPSLETATDIVIGLSEVRSNMNINLGEGQFEGTIGGIITANGAPVPAIKVEAFRGYGSVLYVTTDAAGQYTMTGLLNGPYFIRAQDPTGFYAATFRNGKPVLGASQPVTITGVSTFSDVNFALVPGGEIRGTLRGTNGKPLANAYVGISWYNPATSEELGYAWTTTDQTGSYQIKGLLAGIYRIYFQHLQLPGGQIPYGGLDPKTGQFTPSNIDVTAGVTTTANMTIIRIYLPIMQKN